MLASQRRTLFFVCFNGCALLLCFRLELKQKLQIHLENSLYKGTAWDAFYFKNELYVRAYETMNWEVVDELVNRASVIGIATS